MKQKTLLCLVCMLLLSHLLAGCTTAGQYETATTVPIQTTPAVMPTQPTPAAPTAPPPAPESSVAFETNKAGKTVVHVTGPIDERPAYNYVFNPHVCSSICKLCLGDEVEAELNAYCDAVLAGADSFPCSGADNWARVNAAKAEALPISIFVDLGESFDESLMQDGKYPLTYTVSKSEFSQITAEFQAQVAALIAAADLREGDTELERALKLFSSESLRCVYDYKTEEDFTIRGYQSNAYHVIMEGRGICQEFARDYAYLLQQVGVDASTCGSEMVRELGPHEWTVFLLDGVWYNADVTWQLNEPYALTFFGGTDTERYYHGVLLEYNDFGNYGVLGNEELPIEDLRFEQFGSVKWYRIDHETQTLLYYDDPAFILNDPDSYTAEPKQFDLKP